VEIRFQATQSATWQSVTGDDSVSAGSSATIGQDAGGDFAGETIRITYDSPDSDNTATLGKFEVPAN